MSLLESNDISSQTVDNLRSFQETIEDILNRNGVESYSVEGDNYIPNRQRVLQVVDTFDPAQDRLVARRIRKGFEYEGRVIRPEIIATYKTRQDKE